MKVFSPDHFSNSKPFWETLHSEKCKKLHPIITAFLDNVNFKNLKIEFSGGLEINSKNFKVIDKNSIYLFKKWDSIADVDAIKRTVEINIYLLKKGVKVAEPVQISNMNNYILDLEKESWTCSSFIEGEYFVGSKKQFIKAPLILANICNELINLPCKIHPKSSLVHDKILIENIVIRMFEQKKNWVNIFGPKLSQILDRSWGIIEKALSEIKKYEISPTKLYPMHCDLHPHNILFQNEKLKAIIDYDSIKKTNVGTALAYSSLKLCKQFIVNSGFKNPGGIGLEFKEKLYNFLEMDLGNKNSFYFLALIETLRRISVIFDFNFYQNRKWNMILPLLIGHIKEAEILFKYSNK